MSSIYKIPGYSMDGSVVPTFMVELRQACENDQLQQFVERWAAVWELGAGHKPEEFTKVEAIILSGEGLPEAKSCLSATLSGGNCQHIGQELCVGLAIHMPWSLVLATITASKYGVPHGVALHQLFCDGPHDSCF